MQIHWSAIKYGKVKVVRDEEGDAVDYINEKDYVPFGNNDDATDQFAVDITRRFMNKLRTHKMYRDATPTQSVLTITSNVVYGKKTGNTPDGRRAGAPLDQEQTLCTEEIQEELLLHLPQ